MKSIIIGTLLLLLAGCVATPVARKFPSTPDSLLQSCDKLTTINTDTITLSDFTKSVTQNYGLYQECNIKNEAWIDWYNTQKQIFDEVK